MGKAALMNRGIEIHKPRRGDIEKSYDESLPDYVARFASLFCELGGEPTACAVGYCYGARAAGSHKDMKGSASELTRHAAFRITKAVCILAVFL